VQRQLSQGFRRGSGIRVFRVEGFRVTGFRFKGSGFGVQGRAHDLESRVEGLVLRF